MSGGEGASRDATLANLYRQLSHLALEDPRAFTPRALEALQAQLDLAAASFYSYTPSVGLLGLRAQVGFDYSAYVSLEVGLASLPGEAVKRGTPVAGRCSEMPPASDPLDSCDGCSGQVLVSPLMAPESMAADSRASLVAPSPFGVVCLYPRRLGDLPHIADVMAECIPLLARLYLASLGRHSMGMRSATVERVAFRRDVGSLAYSFIDLLRSEIPVEASSLWILDARRQLLYLRKSMGVNLAEGDDPPTLRPNEPGPLTECFNSRRPVIGGGDVLSDSAHLVGVPLELEPSNVAILPVPLPDSARLRGRPFASAGVLVLVNHFFEPEGAARRFINLSWEEQFLAEFACEMLSVLVYQMLRTQDHESDFERLMHGARTSLQAARGSMQIVDDGALPEAQRHLIPNAIDWLEDLEAQINRDELVDRAALEIEPISLYGDVLAKLGPMVRRMRTRGRTQNFELRGIDDLAQSYRSLPRVKGNTRALHCVFRNLVENSMKYARTDDAVTPGLHLEAKADHSRRKVVVKLRDNGIGIPSSDRDEVFEDGFRGERASGLRPQGVGRGLYECRVLLERMDGEINLVEGEDGCVFEVELPMLREPPTRRRP